MVDFVAFRMLKYLFPPKMALRESLFLIFQNTIEKSAIRSVQNLLDVTFTNFKKAYG